MSAKYLDPVKGTDGLDGKSWEGKEELSSAGNGSWFIFPKGNTGGSATLKVDTGEGKIQFTTSPVDDVLNDTAEAVDWDDGDVTVTTAAAFERVTALRQVNASGTTTLLIRA